MGISRLSRITQWFLKSAPQNGKKMHEIQKLMITCGGFPNLRINNFYLIDNALFV